MQTTIKTFRRLHPQSHRSPAKSRFWLSLLYLAVCCSFLFSSDVFAMQGGSVGVGYFQGPTSGATVNMFLSRSNTLKAIVPFSFNNVIVDYQFLYWDPIKSISRRTIRFNLYIGLGGNLTLGEGGGGNKKGKDGGEIKASVRVPLGLAMRFVRFPVDVFVELAPSLEVYDGNEFGVDGADLVWKKVGVGARFYF